MFSLWFWFVVNHLHLKLILIVLLSGVFASLSFADETGSAPLLPRTGQISTYDLDGNKIEFPGSGQDGEYQRGIVWPEPRFIVNDNGTVSDRLTGLMWLKDGNCFGEIYWPSAQARVEALNKGEEKCHDYNASYDDWFLPGVKDLINLGSAEEVSSSDFLQLSGITNMNPGWYWSGREYKNLQNAWAVDVETGEAQYKNKLSTSFFLPARVENVEKGGILKNLPNLKKITGSKKKEISSTLLSRFIDNKDGTVTDTHTGLMWMKDASCFTATKWLDAFAQVRSLNHDPSSISCMEYIKKYDDWVVPNRNELWSLVDLGVDYPSIMDSPFQKLAFFYWTSTTNPSTPSKAFAVGFDVGSITAKLKRDKSNLLPVRYAEPTVTFPRKESRIAAGLVAKEDHILLLSPDLHSEIHWPPSPRFIVNGDGTSMDIVTGVYWLTDGNCFGKNSWKDTIDLLKIFNRNPRKFDCVSYEGGYADWQLPSVEDYKILVNESAENNAEWLNSQGVRNLLASGDYWTKDETAINLYYAYVYNFKNNITRNYPKSLGFSLWPRRAQNAKENRHPLISLTGNGKTGRASLKSGDTLSLSVLLHSFGLMYPADFWFWYETPDFKKLYLTPIRTWSGVMTPVYQRNLLNLRNYEMYRTTNKFVFAPGEYTFHFAVDDVQNGVMDGNVYESVFTVTAEGSKSNL